MDGLLSLVLLPILGVLNLLNDIVIFGIPFYALVIAFVVISMLIGFIRG